MLNNLATLGLTVLALNVSHEQYCNDMQTLAEQLARARQYGVQVQSFPGSLFMYYSDIPANYLSVAVLIQYAMKEPKENTRQEKDAAITRFKASVYAICQRNLRKF